LHRRLTEEGTTFRALLDDVRRQAALAAIARGAPLKAVAQDLGLSDLRAFHRAFKRWTGTTPATARRAASLLTGALPHDQTR
jgi:AraC-like DNA-binding protein